MGFAHHCWISVITLTSFRKFVNTQKWRFQACYGSYSQSHKRHSKNHGLYCSHLVVASTLAARDSTTVAR